MPTRRRFLITGGSGFLGAAVAGELCAEGERRGVEVEVLLLDIRAPTHPIDAQYIEGDITQYDDVRAACEGVDAVIHCAALVDWGVMPLSELQHVNVAGTENVIRACLDAGVHGLVYTSTMDVVFNGAPIQNGDEALPYPSPALDDYAATKQEAEQLTLQANGQSGSNGGLKTCSIRPGGPMYGPGDPYYIALTLREARAGRLLFRIGDGDTVLDSLYVGNAAYAHALAAFDLINGTSASAGQVYFVTDQPAQNIFQFLEPFLEALGHRMPSRSIPYSLAFGVSAVIESFCHAIHPLVELRPNWTRSTARKFGHNVFFRSDKAARDLGYQPRYSPSEAFEHTVAYFRAKES